MQELFKVEIAPKGFTFVASCTDTLLLSAQRAGLKIPSSCRNGTCRTCICRLLQGRVRYEIEWPGLSFDEKRDGYILPCVAYPESNLVLDDERVARLPEEKTSDSSN